MGDVTNNEMVLPRPMWPPPVAAPRHASERVSVHHRRPFFEGRMGSLDYLTPDPLISGRARNWFLAGLGPRLSVVVNHFLERAGNRRANELASQLLQDCFGAGPGGRRKLLA